MTRPAWGDRWDGLDLLAYAGFVPSIVMTAFGSEKVHNKAHRLGATYVFDKPFPLERFREAVRSLVEDRV